VFVIDFDGLSHISQPVGRNDENRLDIGHRWLLCIPSKCDGRSAPDVPER
jgi:hypothetical protein